MGSFQLPMPSWDLSWSRQPTQACDPYHIPVLRLNPSQLLFARDSNLLAILLWSQGSGASKTDLLWMFIYIGRTFYRWMLPWNPGCLACCLCAPPTYGWDNLRLPLFELLLSGWSPKLTILITKFCKNLSSDSWAKTCALTPLIDPSRNRRLWW